MTQYENAPRSEAPPTFLSERIESYIGPLIEDLAAYEASQRIPAVLAEAVGNRYTLHDELGKGGMATVYLAFDKVLARSVALKVLVPAIGDALKADRFEREIAITSRLQHSRIVPIYDRGDAAGLLFYAMRYVESGSLRDRIERDGQFPIARAIGIGRDIALALDFAHKQGVVHRDVKPENILLENESAFLADFGVARLIDAAGRERLTATGVVVGTAQYMSPEQADPSAPIDGRSDVYALGCVMYEMLAGEPPFTGPTQRDILAKQIAAKVPDITVVRSVVTPAMKAVLEIALRKSAADRYETAGAFMRAFEAAVAAPATAVSELASTGRSRATRRQIGLAIGVVALAAAALVLPVRAITARALGSFRLVSREDSTRLAVFPFLYDASTAERIQERQIIGDAIRRWRGLTVVDEIRLTERLAQDAARGGPIDPNRLALDLGAGRFVRGEISRIRDSLRIHAALYDARSDRLIRDGTVRVAATLHGLDSASADLSAQLLFGSSRADIRTPCLKTALPSAYRACTNALAHIDDWKLPEAEAQFSAALTADPGFAFVHLALAQLRSWRHEPVANWSSEIKQAEAGRAALDPVQQLKLDALAASAAGNAERSCQLWERLVVEVPHSFDAWYGLGGCLYSDSIVVPDARSNGQWRFRSSRHRTLAAYRRAFELRPAALTIFKDDLFAGVREMFVTSRSVLMGGRSAGPNPIAFLGRAAWRGDSLVFIPFPKAAVRAGARETLLPNTDEAVRRQRRIFADAATSWVASSHGAPSRASALEALAFALEMLGDPSAVDTLRSARVLATTDAERGRIAIHEVWLRLKFAIPDNLAAIDSARALADSLLGLPAGADGRLAQFQAGLAALTGRASLAALLASNPFEIARRRDPAAVARSGLALVAFAAHGGPSDTLRRLESQFHAAVKAGVAARDQRGARQQWSARAATLAFPDLPPDLSHIPRGDDALLDAQLAARANDSRTALAYLSGVSVSRARIAAADLSFDGILPEVALIDHLGDPARAIAWLDPLLSALPHMAPLATADVAQAACLVRSLILRAELAERMGDRTQTRRWSRAAHILWSDADPFLQPTVRRMAALSQ